MGKIGVGVGEDFPVGDPRDPRNGEGGQAGTAAEAAGNASAQSDATEDRAEFERWRREGQRAWDEDVRNQHPEWQFRHRAEWDRWKRGLKNRIRTAVIDGLGREENWRRHSWGYSWRPRSIGAWGIGIVALILAVPILAVILLVALIAAAISAPLVVLVLLGLLIAGVIAHHSHGKSHHAGRYRYYTDDDIQSPPRSSRAPCPRPRGPIVTPPPQEHS